MASATAHGCVKLLSRDMQRWCNVSLAHSRWVRLCMSALYSSMVLVLLGQLETVEMETGNGKQKWSNRCKMFPRVKPLFSGHLLKTTFL